MAIRHFNTAGPSVVADHYCLDPLIRINLEEIFLQILPMGMVSLDRQLRISNAI